jgi:RNA polymerase sigma-70 factor (ECF subfamily)
LAARSGLQNYKTALNEQAMNRQRRVKERAARTPEPGWRSHDELPDRLELLDEAMSRLPAKYRAVIVLCDLEGKTIKEAAKQLVCPCGTIASRLATGRKLLAKRLTRYGLGLTAMTAVQDLARGAVAAVVPKPLHCSTVKAAAMVAAGQAVAGVMSAKVILLTERVVKAMLIAKLRTFATASVVLLVLGASGLVWSRPTFTAQQRQDRPAPTPGDRQVKQKPKSDQELIQGTWIPVSGEQDGEPLPKEKYKQGKLVFSEDKFSLQVLEMGQAREGTFALDPEKQPNEIDLTFGDTTRMGIYKLEGKKLTLVMSERGRPSDFDSTGATMVTFEKKEKK